MYYTRDSTQLSTLSTPRISHDGGDDTTCDVVPPTPPPSECLIAWGILPSSSSLRRGEEGRRCDCGCNEIEK